MKNIIITILLQVVIVFAQQTEIDGKLKVKGGIDASGNPITNVGIPLTDTDAVNPEFLKTVISGDGPYDYKYYFVLIPNHQHSYADQSYQLSIKYFSIDWTDQGNGWQSKIDQLSSEGWIIYQQFQVGSSGSTYRVGSTNLNSNVILVTLRKPADN